MLRHTNAMEMCFHFPRAKLNKQFLAYSVRKADLLSILDLTIKVIQVLGVECWQSKGISTTFASFQLVVSRVSITDCRMLAHS